MCLFFQMKKNKYLIYFMFTLLNEKHNNQKFRKRKIDDKKTKQFFIREKIEH